MPTCALADVGFWMQMYGSKLGRQVPSAKKNDFAGVAAPTTSWPPVTWMPSELLYEKYIGRSATMFVRFVVWTSAEKSCAASSPVPSLLFTLSVWRECARTVTLWSTVLPSPSMYSTVTSASVAPGFWMQMYGSKFGRQVPSAK